MIFCGLQGTKNFHEQYFESKKNRDKNLANTRRDVDKAHKEVKGTDKPKVVRAGVPVPNPMQEIINKEAGNLIRSHCINLHVYNQNQKPRQIFQSKLRCIFRGCSANSEQVRASEKEES